MRFVMLKSLQSSSRPYLFMLVASAFAGELLQYLQQYVWRGIPNIYGQGPLIYIPAWGATCALLCWFSYRGTVSKSHLLSALLVVLGLAWVVHVIISRVHGDAITYASIVYIWAIAALALKTPNESDAHSALLLLAWLITISLVAVRALELMKAIPMVNVGSELVAFERAHYWLPLSNTIGPEGRWPGPMGHNAKTGNMAAMLVVISFGVKSRSKWFFGIVGLLTLLLTSSQSSQIAAIAGVTAVTVFGSRHLARRVRSKWIALALLALAGIGLLSVLIRNPGLTGRTTYWRLSLEVWQSSPWFGVGSSGIRSSAAALVGSNAHNIVIDSLIKYGLVGTSLVVLALGLSGALAYRATLNDSAIPIGIWVAFFVIGLTEADIDWIRISLPWLWLVLASLMAAGAPRNQQNGSVRLILGSHVLPRSLNSDRHLL